MIDIWLDRIVAKDRQATRSGVNSSIPWAKYSGRDALHMSFACSHVYIGCRLRYNVERIRLVNTRNTSRADEWWNLSEIPVEFDLKIIVH